MFSLFHWEEEVRCCFQLHIVFKNRIFLTIKPRKNIKPSNFCWLCYWCTFVWLYSCWKQYPGRLLDKMGWGQYVDVFHCYINIHWSSKSLRCFRYEGKKLFWTCNIFSMWYTCVPGVKIQQVFLQFPDWFLVKSNCLSNFRSHPRF